MNRFQFFIIPFLGMVILTIIVYWLPQIAPGSGPKIDNNPNYYTLIKDRYRSIAQILASSDQIIDAIVMEDNFSLNAFLKKIGNLEPDLLYINITDPANNIVGSLDTMSIGEKYKRPTNLKPLTNEPILIQESSSNNMKQLHYALPVLSSGQKIASLYLGAKASVSLALAQTEPVKVPKSRLVLVVGLAFAVIVSLLMVAVAGAIKGP